MQDRAREDKKVPPLKLKLQNVAQLTAVYWKYKACMTVIILPPMKSTKEINSIQPKFLKAPPNSCAVILKKKKKNSNTVAMIKPKWKLSRNLILLTTISPIPRTVPGIWFALSNYVFIKEGETRNVGLPLLPLPTRGRTLDSSPPHNSSSFNLQILTHLPLKEYTLTREEYKVEGHK